MPIWYNDAHYNGYQQQQQQARHTNGSFLVISAAYQHPYIPHRVCESQELSSSPKDNCVIGVFCCCIWLPVLVFESVWQQSDGVPRRSELPRKSVAFESELVRKFFCFFLFRFKVNKRFSTIEMMMQKWRNEKILIKTKKIMEQKKTLNRRNTGRN